MHYNRSTEILWTLSDPAQVNSCDLHKSAFGSKYLFCSNSRFLNWILLSTGTISFVQNNTPIYNMAAGTCLGVTRDARNAQVIMDLCTKTNTSLISWDLVRSKVPSKDIRWRRKKSRKSRKKSHKDWLGRKW